MLNLLFGGQIAVFLLIVIALVISLYPVNPGSSIAERTILDIIDDVRFSKVQNMAHSRNLAAFIRTARVRFDYQLGVEPVGGTPEEFAAFIRSEMKLGQELVKLANIKPQ